MFLRLLYPNLWTTSRRFSRTSAIFAATTPARHLRCGTGTITNGVDEQWMVLRSLVDGFGGEATSADLCRQISRKFPSLGWHKIHSCPRVRSILVELELSRAVTLECLGRTELVARIQLQGAIAADQHPDADAYLPMPARASDTLA